MAFYQKSDLVYNDYEWTESIKDTPRLKGDPDRNLFKRYEGYEMLYMINQLGSIMGKTTVEDGNEMERLLHDKLPLDIKSQWNVYQWLSKQLNDVKEKEAIL